MCTVAFVTWLYRVWVFTGRCSVPQHLPGTALCKGGVSKTCCSSLLIAPERKKYLCRRGMAAKSKMRKEWLVGWLVACCFLADHISHLDV